MKYSNEIKEKIKNLYSQNKNTVEISNELGISQTGVERFLKKSSLYVKKINSKISLKQIENIIDLFVNKKMNAVEISKIYFCSDSLIRKLLQKNNINTGLEGRYNKASNLDYFERIDTEQKAYLLGFIYTDGSIDKTQRTLSIEINKKDIEILKSICNIFNLSFEEIKITRKNCVKLSIHSKKLCLDLCNLNVKPNKTYMNDIPDIPLEYYSHFLRGLIDGDGSITNTTICLYSKNLNLINNVKNVFLSLSIPENKIHVYFKDSCSRISVFQKEYRKILFDYLYKDATIYLNRKKISPV